MNEKEFSLDVFDNTNDEITKKIAAYCPASDEEKERMFAMSRKIYNERIKESNNKGTVEVTGVERYNKPVCQKIMSAVAVLVLITGIGTGGALMLKNNSKPPQTTLPVPITTETIGVSPFGDLNGYEVKIKHPYLDDLVVPDEEFSREIIKSFNEGTWTQLPNDKEPDPAVSEAIHVILTKEDVSVFFLLYSDKYILCEQGASQTKWEVSEDIKNAVYDAYNAMRIVDETGVEDKNNAGGEESAPETAADDFETIEVPNTEYIKKELAVDLLEERGLHVEIVNKESSDIQPGYIIKSEPVSGEKVLKGTIVILYVSTGAETATITMDNYIGMNIDDATTMADYRSMKVLCEEIDSSEKAGIVVGQEPQPGEEVETGSDIVFYVSKGTF